MRHSLRFTLIACVLALALVASSMAAAAGPTATAAKKHCKAGYHVVTVKKHGKKHKVCRKNHYIQQQG